MSRDVVWALVGIGAACWAIGGGGPKWVRRYLWPSILGIVGLLFTGSWLSVLGAACLSGACHLGYGEGTSTAWRVIVWSSYGFALIPFGVPWWFGLITAGILTGCWWLSRTYNWITWKWWELTAGALQGFAVAQRLLSG